MEENITFNEEPFGKLDEDEIVHPIHSNDVLDIWALIAKFIHSAIIFASICATILLIYAIRRFRYLQTKSNMVLMHYLVSNGVFIVALPLNELFISLYPFVPMEVICVMFRVNTVGVTLMLTFTGWLGLDFVTSAYCTTYRTFYEKHLNYLILFTYLVYLTELVPLCWSCFGTGHMFSDSLGVPLYVTFTISVIVINGYRWYKKPVNADHSYYNLVVCNYIALTWFPMLVIDLLFEGVTVSATDVLIVLIEFFCMVSLYVPAVVIACWIPRLNPDFSRAYSAVFRRLTRKATEPINSDGSEHSEGDTNPILI